MPPVAGMLTAQCSCKHYNCYILCLVQMLCFCEWPISNLLFRFQNSTVQCAWKQVSCAWNLAIVEYFCMTLFDWTVTGYRRFYQFHTKSCSNEFVMLRFVHLDWQLQYFVIAFLLGSAADLPVWCPPWGYAGAVRLPWNACVVTRRNHRWRLAYVPPGCEVNY